MVFPILGRTLRTRHRGTDIGQSIPHDTGTELPTEDEHSPRHGGWRSDEVFNEERLLAMTEEVLRDDEDATELATTGQVLVGAYLADVAPPVKPCAGEQTV
jgi:hypothetical protein